LGVNTNQESKTGGVANRSFPLSQGDFLTEKAKDQKIQKNKKEKKESHPRKLVKGRPRQENKEKELSNSNTFQTTSDDASMH